MLQFVPATASSVLEVGCNTGAFAAELRVMYPECFMVGIEPEDERAVVARQVFDEVVTGAFPALRSAVAREGGFDLIVCNDVLEHIAEPGEALTSMLDMMSKDGMLVASIPNVRHVSAVGPLLLKGEWEYKDSGVLDRTHLRFFTERSIRRLFIESGWRIVRMEGINRGFRRSDKETRWWIKFLSAASGGRSDAFFFVQYAVVAKPARHP